MSKCLYGLLGCMSATLFAITRALLMVGCLLMLASSIIGLWGLHTVETELSELHFPGIEVTLVDYVSVILSICISCVGTYGVYTKDPHYLRLFAFAMAATAVSRILTTGHSARDEWAKSQEPFTELMESYAHDYQWTRQPGQSPNKATRAWDLVQTKLLCCGLNGPKDWPQKWKQSDRRVLPRSCCSSIPRAVRAYPWMDDRCDIENAYDVGCIERIETAVENTSKCMYIFVVMYTVMALMAAILAKQSELSLLSAACVQLPSNPYQRFDGNIHVQQPAPTGHQLNYGKQPPVVPSFYQSTRGLETDREAPPKYERS